MVVIVETKSIVSRFPVHRLRLRSADTKQYSQLLLRSSLPRQQQIGFYLRLFTLLYPPCLAALIQNERFWFESRKFFWLCSLDIGNAETRSCQLARPRYSFPLCTNSVLIKFQPASRYEYRRHSFANMRILLPTDSSAVTGTQARCINVVSFGSQDIHCYKHHSTLCLRW